VASATAHAATARRRSPDVRLTVAPPG
jgi:hypothetical protein